MHAATVQYLLLISLANQLADKAFPLSKEFPISTTAYYCEAVFFFSSFEAVQCLDQQLVKPG